MSARETLTVKDIKNEAKDRFAVHRFKAMTAYCVQLFVIVNVLVFSAVLFAITAALDLPLIVSWVFLAYGWLLVLIVMFLSGPFAFSMADYYLRAYNGKDPEAAYAFEGYGKANFVRASLLHLLRFAIFLLLTCLFIIPGIIFGIKTSMAFFLMRANPKMKPVAALKTSSKVMKGHSFLMFKLGLSFIVWVILGILTLGAGFIYVAPYYNVCKTILYKRAVQGDKSVPAEQPRPAVDNGGAATRQFAGNNNYTPEQNFAPPVEQYAEPQSFAPPEQNFAPPVEQYAEPQSFTPPEQYEGQPVFENTESVDYGYTEAEPETEIRPQYEETEPKAFEDKREYAAPAKDPVSPTATYDAETDTESERQTHRYGGGYVPPSPPPQSEPKPKASPEPAPPVKDPKRAAKEAEEKRKREEIRQRIEKLKREKNKHGARPDKPAPKPKPQPPKKNGKSFSDIIEEAKLVSPEPVAEPEYIAPEPVAEIEYTAPEPIIEQSSEFVAEEDYVPTAQTEEYIAEEETPQSEYNIEPEYVAVEPNVEEPAPKPQKVKDEFSPEVLDVEVVDE